MSGSHQIGKYEVKELIARDAACAVYRGLDGQKVVALKVIPRKSIETAALMRLRATSKALLAFAHPLVTRFLDLVETDHVVSIVTEVAPGKTLAARKPEGSLELAWQVGMQLLDMLAAAHGKGVLHGNLKPQNVFLDDAGRLTVSDFSTYELVRSHAEAAAAYSAPEQHSGTAAPDARTDLYQVGAIIYHVMTGKAPFAGTYEEVVHRVLEERPTDPSNYVRKIAWQLDWVIQRALSKDPLDRFAKPKDFIDGLKLGLQDSLGVALSTAIPGGGVQAAKVEAKPQAASDSLDFSDLPAAAPAKPAAAAPKPAAPPPATAKTAAKPAPPAKPALPPAAAKPSPPPAAKSAPPATAAKPAAAQAKPTPAPIAAKPASPPPPPAKPAPPPPAAAKPAPPPPAAGKPAAPPPAPPAAAKPAPPPPPAAKAAPPPPAAAKPTPPAAAAKPATPPPTAAKPTAPPPAGKPAAPAPPAANPSVLAKILEAAAEANVAPIRPRAKPAPVASAKPAEPPPAIKSEPPQPAPQQAAPPQPAPPQPATPQTAPPQPASTPLAPPPPPIAESVVPPPAKTVEPAPAASVKPAEPPPSPKSTPPQPALPQPAATTPAIAKGVEPPPAKIVEPAPAPKVPEPVIAKKRVELTLEEPEPTPVAEAEAAPVAKAEPGPARALELKLEEPEPTPVAEMEPAPAAEAEPAPAIELELAPQEPEPAPAEEAELAPVASAEPAPAMELELVPHEPAPESVEEEQPQPVEMVLELEPREPEPEPVEEVAPVLPEEELAVQEPELEPVAKVVAEPVEAPSPKIEEPAPKVAEPPPKVEEPAPKVAEPPKIKEPAPVAKVADEGLLQKAKLLAARPAAPAEAPAKEAAATSEAEPAESEDGKKVSVLFVDDEERVLNALRALFRKTYRVHTATSGAEAMKLLERESIPIVVSDQRMPEMTGVEFLRKVCKISPNTVRLLLTGYSDLGALVSSINEGEIFRFIWKPWDNEKMREALAEAVEESNKLASPPEPHTITPSPRNAGSILVIAQTPSLAAGLQRLVAGEAKVEVATTPRDAAKILQLRDFAAVVADLAVGKDGLVSLFQLLKSHRPQTLSILVADEPDSELVAELINSAHIYRFMAKPVNGRELRHHVSTALRRYAETVPARLIERRAAAPQRVAQTV